MASEYRSSCADKFMLTLNHGLTRSNPVGVVYVIGSAVQMPLSLHPAGLGRAVLRDGPPNRAARVARLP